MATSAENTQAHIDRLQGFIEAYSAALLVFAQNGMQKSYDFDSGQQTIKVERESPAVINKLINGWMNQQQILCQRLGTASGTVVARGRW